MLKKTIAWNGAKITVRRAKVRDVLLARGIVNKLGVDNNDPGDFFVKQAFAEFVTLAQVDGDLGFSLPSPADSKEELAVALECYLELDIEFYNALEGAITEVSRPLNDPDLLPSDQVPEKKEPNAE